MIFGVACTVASIVGYLVQQFLIGTGIAKVLGKLKDAGKFALMGPWSSRSRTSTSRSG